MNSKKRILTALNNKQSDKVPIFELYINESSIVNLTKVLKPELVQIKATRDRFGEERLEILDLYCFLIKELELDATCSNFSMGLERINDSPGRDDQEMAANVEDLIGKMVKPITLGDGTQIEIYSPTLEYRDVDINGRLWTEKSKEYGAIQFDYFFLTQGANDEFLRIDHIYPEELVDILEASDHILIVLDLADD